ncbi:hypothetical protein BT96DRAFT_386179 [Gymnopus androsaceus JB14]|uniref:Zn(2)-C6 fungal-type domain-containing protein n=1 Tax=Gymnopus androsaceus JB14 TaxID=1447944 RepID=A0A6A4I4Z0_9AGAR|nr:hypothetical protein BT96DRAFT_386179 [Gymnopus androsaceus JB14]
MATHTSTYSISPRARSHKGNAPTLPKTKYCTMCPAQFTRTTHLNRHIRSHTNERCHRCHICGAEFTRSDLLARHKKTCREGNGAPRSRRRSCQSCVRSKVKCDLLQPCSRCASHGKECVYLNNPEEFRHRKNAAFHSANAQVHLTLLPRYSADTPPSSQGSEQPISVNSVNPGRSLLQPDAASSTPYRQSDPELHSNPVNFEFSTLTFSPTLPVAFNTELRDQRMTSEFSMQDGLQSQLDLHPHWRQPHVHDGLLSVNLDITEFPCDETRSSNSLEVAGFFPNHVTERQREGLR